MESRGENVAVIYGVFVGYGDEEKGDVLRVGKAIKVVPVGNGGGGLRGCEVAIEVVLVVIQSVGATGEVVAIKALYVDRDVDAESVLVELDGFA